MWSWDDVIGGSAAWGRNELFGTELAEMEASHPANDVLFRARGLQAHLRSRLRASDPTTVVVGALQSVIPQAISNVHTRLHEHLGGATPDGAHMEMDTLAAHVASLPLPVGLEGADAPAAIDAAQALALAAAERVAQKVEVLELEISRLKAVSDELRTEALAQARADLDATRSELAVLRGEVGVVLDSFRADFAREQERRDGEHLSATEAAAKAHETALADFRTASLREAEARNGEAASALEALEARGQEFIDVLSGFHDEAVRLVGAMGRIGLTNGYMEWENSEKVAADEFRKRTLRYGIAGAVSLIAVVAAHVLTDIFVDDAPFDFTLTTAGIALPAAFGAIATYAAREANKHRRNEVLARRTALELASFGPFIAQLDPHKQEQLTAMFTPVFFGQAPTVGSSEAGDHGFRPPTQEVLGQIMTKLASPD